MTLDPSPHRGAHSAPEAAEHRRSIRRYREEAISRGLLMDLLRLAGRAPSAFNLQPWRLIVVQDSALRARLREAAFGQPQVQQAPAVLVLYTDMVDTLARVEAVLPAGLEDAERAARVDRILGSFQGMSPEALEDWGARQGNLFLGYLLLLAESMGLATSPMLGFDPARVRELLEIPAHCPLSALVALGWPGEEGIASRRHDPEAIARFC